MLWYTMYQELESLLEQKGPAMFFGQSAMEGSIYWGGGGGGGGGGASPPQKKTSGNYSPTPK